MSDETIQQALATLHTVVSQADQLRAENAALRQLLANADQQREEARLLVRDMLNILMGIQALMAKRFVDPVQWCHRVVDAINAAEQARDNAVSLSDEWETRHNVAEKQVAALRAALGQMPERIDAIRALTGWASFVENGTATKLVDEAKAIISEALGATPEESAT